jgi:hypothetical protein
VTDLRRRRAERALAVGHRDDRDRDAPGQQLGQQAADTERLVVRMRRDDDDGSRDLVGRPGRQGA